MGNEIYFWIITVSNGEINTSTQRPAARAQSGWYATRQELFEHCRINIRKKKSKFKKQKRTILM